MSVARGEPEWSQVWCHGEGSWKLHCRVAYPMYLPSTTTPSPKPNKTVRRLWKHYLLPLSALDEALSPRNADSTLATSGQTKLNWQTTLSQKGPQLVSLVMWFMYLAQPATRQVKCHLLQCMICVNCVRMLRMRRKMWLRLSRRLWRWN